MIALLLSAALAAPPMPGQDNYSLPDLNAEPWRPALASGHFLATEEVRADSPFTGRVDLRWAHHPLVWQEGGEGEITGVLSEAVAVDLSATWALGPLRLGLWAPAYVHTQSDITDSRGTALGDGRIQALYALADDTWGLGLRLAAGVPLGGVNRVVGQGGVSGEVALVADADAGPVRLAAEVGWEANPEVVLTTEESLSGSLDIRLGAAWRAWEHTAITAEFLGGWIPGLIGSNGLPGEVVLGASHRSARGHALRGGLSMALTPAVGVPTYRLVLGVGHLPHMTQ